MLMRLCRDVLLACACAFVLAAAAAAPVVRAAPASGSGPPGSVGPTVSHYLTLPADFPPISVTYPAQGAADGLLFLTPFANWAYNPSFLLIMDNSGQPVYYQSSSDLLWDFRVLPDGRLIYAAGDHYVVMDNSYTVVDTFRAGNGYPMDVHDLRVLPDGHALVLGLDVHQNVDMSQIVPGGDPHAQVTGVVVQELDAARNVIFEWRGWDHFQITDSYLPLTAAWVDYVHADSVELDADGNILLSSRNLSEITKIDRRTGAVIWRLGGKNNQFTFIGDVPPYFQYQHDVRRLPNGDITLLDNRSDLSPVYSRAVAYRLDEQAKTATLVWQYRNVPDTYAPAMGNVQRLPNGNTLIGWGTAGIVTEVTSAGAKVFEASTPYLSYRALRFPWHGRPATAPVLVAHKDARGIALTYSWNGATDIASYSIYEGPSIQNQTLVAMQVRAGFETQTMLPNNSQDCRFFRVLPIDTGGRPTRYSNLASTCPQIYLPTLRR